MTQSSGATTDLQLRCNFRWILFANHIEPVRGYLGRSLRRSLLRLEVDSRTHNPEMYTVVEWVSKSFIMINKFLESHSSQDASLSPQYFLQCPMEVTASRLWFINLWNLNLGMNVQLILQKPIFILKSLDLDKSWFISFLIFRVHSMQFWRRESHFEIIIIAEPSQPSSL